MHQIPCGEAQEQAASAAYSDCKLQFPAIGSIRSQSGGGVLFATSGDSEAVASQCFCVCCVDDITVAEQSSLTLYQEDRPLLRGGDFESFEAIDSATRPIEPTSLPLRELPTALPNILFSPAESLWDCEHRLLCHLHTLAVAIARETSQAQD